MASIKKLRKPKIFNILTNLYRILKMREVVSCKFEIIENYVLLDALRVPPTELHTTTYAPVAVLHWLSNMRPSKLPHQAHMLTAPTNLAEV